MESIEKINNDEQSGEMQNTHPEVGNEGKTYTREELLSSIDNKEEAVEQLLGDKSDEEVQASFNKLPDEKKSAILAKIAKIDATIDRSEAIIKGYGRGENSLKGIQEIRQIFLQMRKRSLEKKL